MGGPTSMSVVVGYSGVAGVVAVAIGVVPFIDSSGGNGLGMEGGVVAGGPPDSHQP